MDNAAWLDAIAQAELVRTREVSPAELVEAAAGRADDANRTLGFLIERIYEQAQRDAAGVTPDGPLAGVPMLVKDHLATIKGVRHTSGSRYLRNHVAGADSELVRRYRAAGLIPIGTSATCEFALISTAESERYGPCRNPWDLQRTAGGSSGGAASAVAAGVVALAHGNDAGGSIRIPSSCCGTFGLKPTRGRNPLGPAFGDVGGGIWAEHVLTRSVRDSAAVLDATFGPMPGDPYCPPARRGSYLDETLTEPRRLRIGFTASAPTGVPVDEECVAAVRDAAALCEVLGHDVEEAALPIDGARLEEAFFVVYAAGAAWTLQRWERELGRSPEPGELEPFTAAMVELGKSYRASEFLLALEHIQADARRIAAFYATHDLALSPTLGAPPVPLGHFAPPPEDPLRVLYTDAAFAAFTWTANATGQPAMSVPLYWTQSNLPVGVHFTARVGDESTLFQLAAQLEIARPWSMRRPPIAEQLGV